MRSKDYLILRTYINDQVGDFVDEHQHNIQEFDPQLVRRLVEKITIFKRYMEFTFKDGEVIKVVLHYSVLMEFSIGTVFRL